MNKSHETQIERYGGEEGYRAEMKRRRAMRTTYGKGGFEYLKRIGREDLIVEASKKGIAKLQDIREKEF